MKTLQECKEEAAKKWGWKSFNKFFLQADKKDVESMMTEAAELYTSQFTTPVEVEEPMIGYKEVLKIQEENESVGKETQEELWNDIDNNYIQWNDQQMKTSEILRDFIITRR